MLRRRERERGSENIRSIEVVYKRLPVISRHATSIESVDLDVAYGFLLSHHHCHPQRAMKPAIIFSDGFCKMNFIRKDKETERERENGEQCDAHCSIEN